MAADRSTPPLILLVDDYEDARVMYGHFLRMSGFEPLEASTGEEALELAYRVQASVEQACGPATAPLDRAILLIGRRHGLDRP